MSDRAITTTYVAFVLPGVLFNDISSAEKVASRDPKRDAAKAPKNAVALFYFDITTSKVKVKGKSVQMNGDHHNISKTYYIDAELFTADQIAALPGDRKTLLNNMRINDLTHVVRCRTGHFQEFDADKYELVSTS